MKPTIDYHLDKPILTEEETASVIAATPFLDGYPLRIRREAVAKGWTEESFPRCPICGDKRRWNSAYDTMALTCLKPHCVKERGKLPEDIWTKLSNRDWLYHERVELRKSYAAIGAELGVSEVPVRKFAKSFELPNENYRKVTPAVTSKLENREWLVQQYVEAGKTYSQIAVEVGTSSGVVIDYLQSRYGIPPRATNTYPRKFARRSKWHTELGSWLDGLGIEVQWDNRTILDGKEIDLYLPKYRLGVECNGLFYHRYIPNAKSEALRKGPDYHLSKTLLAQQNGVRLLQFFEDEWDNRPEVVKSIISSKLGINRRVGARKLKIVDVFDSQRYQFLDENHIQGRDGATVALGLKSDEEGILCMMTFCKSRYNRNHPWELSRFCNKAGVNVVGGFTRLLKAFRIAHPGSIISYADRRISTGDVYEHNGFCLERVNPPSYWYMDKKYNRRYHRASFQLSKIRPNPDDPRTEREIMEERGWCRIYDCGTLAYALG